MLLRGLDSEILVYARQLLYPPSNSTKSCINSISRSLAQIFRRYLSNLKRLVVLLVLFHLRKYFSGVPQCRIAGLRVVAGQDELHCAKESLIELGLLIGKALAIPSPMVMRLFFSSSIPMAMPSHTTPSQAGAHDAA